MGKDLGTYHLRVELDDGQGWIERWDTGRRIAGGYRNGTFAPISVMLGEPVWGDEEELLNAILFMYTEGNFSCDCNRRLFLAYSQGEKEPEAYVCGQSLTLRSLVVIRPDGSELRLYPASKESL